MEQFIGATLEELGITRDLRGFRISRDAVLEIIEANGVIPSKCVRALSIDRTGTERAVRYATVKIRELNTDRYKEILGKIPKLTARSFLFTLAGWVEENYTECTLEHMMGSC
jgi:hypothetical protein